MAAEPVSAKADVTFAVYTFTNSPRLIMAWGDEVLPECPSLLRAFSDAPEEISVLAPVKTPAISAPNFPPVILSVPATLRFAAAYPEGYFGAAELEKLSTESAKSL